MTDAKIAALKGALLIMAVILEANDELAELITREMKLAVDRMIEMTKSI